MIKRVFRFYLEGFKNLSKTGKKLWIIIIIKIIVFFVIIKTLFFPDILKEKFHTDKERSDYILHQLTKGE